MSAKEMQNLEVKTTTHYWGYRELDASEIEFVGGGYDADGFGDGGDTGNGQGEASDGAAASNTSGGASTGGRGCTAADTQASCSARSEGYAACNTFGGLVGSVAGLFGNSSAKSLASEIAGLCKNGVDRSVDAAFRTDMYENGAQQNQQPSFSGYDGNN